MTIMKNIPTSLHECNLVPMCFASKYYLGHCFKSPTAIMWHYSSWCPLETAPPFYMFTFICLIIIWNVSRSPLCTAMSNAASCTILGNYSKVVFEGRSSTGGEAFSLSIALTLPNLYCSVSLLLHTAGTGPEIWAKQCLVSQKSTFGRRTSVRNVFA